MGVAARGIMLAISSNAARPGIVFGPQKEKPKHPNADTKRNAGKLSSGRSECQLKRGKLRARVD